MRALQKINYGKALTLAWYCGGFFLIRTLKSKSASEKFLCSPGDKNCVVTTMILQNAKHYTVSLQNKVAAKNR